MSNRRALRVTTAHDGAGIASLASADFVFHLAGVNRPKDEDEFAVRQPGLYGKAVRGAGSGRRRKTPIVVCIIHAGRTRQSLRPQQARPRSRFCCDMAEETGSPVHHLPADQRVRQMGAARTTIPRSRPSAINIARGLPITINDPAAPLSWSISTTSSTRSSAC